MIPGMQAPPTLAFVPHAPVWPGFVPVALRTTPHRQPAGDEQAAIVASWVYVGSGYGTEGERWLALSAAARAREQRRIAREELTTTTRSAAA
jgi:hypothetical protein